MALTEHRILTCADDGELIDLLLAELQARLPGGRDWECDRLLRELKTLPTGLRAMAATYELDVSLCLDDLGWHFANWHHRGMAKETLWALRELEAFEEADLFERAYLATQPFWDEIGRLIAEDFDDFAEWYHSDRKLEEATMPMTARFWELRAPDPNGLFGLWARYARRHPHKVAQLAS